MREAYKKLKEAIQNGDEPPILDPLAMVSRFHLFSVEHVDYCCHGDTYLTRSVSFCHLSELIQVANGATTKDSTDDNPKPLYGDIYLGTKTDCEMDRFFPPIKAGIEKHKVTANEGKLTLDVRFLSNDDLIISIPATVVFGSKPIHPSAPRSSSSREFVISSRCRCEAGIIGTKGSAQLLPILGPRDTTHQDTGRQRELKHIIIINAVSHCSR